MPTQQGYKLFVRWNNLQNSRHQVELELDGEVIQTKIFLKNDLERIYGYCSGVVDTLMRLGTPIQMPHCLEVKSFFANMARED